MRIDFWFDPTCPFTWITSRWMCRTAPERSTEVRWRSLSLAIVHEDEPPSDARQRSLGQLRVVEAVRKAGLEDRIGDLYTELGRRTHDEQDRSFPVTDALAACDLPLALAGAVEDDSYDGLIRDSMAEASALVGDDTGVPVIAWGPDGDRIGFFGPILTELPEVGAGVRIFDAVVELASVPSFTELKRAKSRPVLPAT